MAFVSDAKISIVVPGATGRMGKLIAEEALNDRRHALVGATCRSDGPHVGDDVGDILGRGAIGVETKAKLQDALADLPAKGRAVVVDFTRPHLAVAHALAAANAGAGLVVGTTGLDDEAQSAIDKAAESVPVLLAANTSVGANLLRHFVGQAAKAMHAAGVEVDHEIVELHHRHKRDAPSGTALDLADAIASETGRSLDDVVAGRQGQALRQPNEIGVFGVRGGSVPGEHTAYFFLEDERVEFAHRVTNRRIFATGALTAARFLAGQPAGRYTMADVLSL